jgi:amino acid transporter
MDTSDPSTNGPTKHQLGTFAGVFTPSVLTILGVIMFLRAGFVVGQGGVSGALLVLLIAETIVLLTVLSIGAIATNTQVHGGGAYYLISRVLGPEFGGAIGITLYFAQSLSVPFYILGFSEAFVQSFPVLKDHIRWICIGTASLLFALNYVGVKWALKAQFIILGVLALAIITFLGGLALKFDPALFRENWAPDFSSNMSFWIVFAIYFPAVTGIMAGINMSGDLRNPGRSLTRGTLAAVLVGFLVYGLQIILMGGAETRSVLLASPYASLVWNALLGAGFLVVAGMFAATISSAMSSFMAAPRVMQAIARDRLLRPLNALALGTRKGDEPRRALTVTFVITLIVLWIATAEDAGTAFNRVAALVTMFFLCTYMIINVAAFVEAFGSNPSFRPRFKWFHWSTALTGAIGCLAIMTLIHLGNALVAVALIGALYAYMSRRAYVTTYGDARRGFVYAAISKHLLRLRDIRRHPKNWRPTILVLSGNPESRLNLILYGVWLEAGRGIVTVAQLITGRLRDLIERRNQALERLSRFIREQDINAFPEVVVAEDFDEGVRLLLQGHSIGPIKPNIALMGWPSDKDRIRPFVRHLRDIRTLGMSVVSVIDRGVPPPEKEKRIDVWWRGQENGSLMLILAHLLTRNWEWARSSIRIFRLVDKEEAHENARHSLTELVEAARITAEVDVIVSDHTFKEVFQQRSRDASVIFLGFYPVEEEEAEPFHDTFTALLQDMPTAILVSSCGEADLLA